MKAEQRELADSIIRALLDQVGPQTTAPVLVEDDEDTEWRHYYSLSNGKVFEAVILTKGNLDFFILEDEQQPVLIATIRLDNLKEALKND